MHDVSRWARTPLALISLFAWGLCLLGAPNVAGAEDSEPQPATPEPKNVPVG